MPITSAGVAPNANNRIRAVGALPIKTSALGWALSACSMPMAVRVSPAGAKLGAQSNTECTGFAKVRAAMGATAAAAMAVSVRITAFAANAAIAKSQAPGENRSNGARLRSPLLCTSLSNTSCSAASKPVGPNQAWIRAMLSVKIG